MVDYTTVLEVANKMHITYDVPSASDPSQQGLLVECTKYSTSDLYYTTGIKNLITSSVDLYYGAADIAALSNKLTVTTHYSVYDAERGIILLTSAGETLVDDNKLFLKCKAITSGFNGDGLNESKIQDEIDNVKALIDSQTNAVFGELISEEGEYHDGQGSDIYYPLRNRPVAEISSVKSVEADNTYTKVAKAYYHLDPETEGHMILDYVPAVAMRYELRAFKIAYEYGYEEVPTDIAALAVLWVNRNIAGDQIITNYGRGQSVDNVENLDVFEKTKMNIINKYKNSGFSIATKRRNNVYRSY